MLNYYKQNTLLINGILITFAVAVTYATVGPIAVFALLLLPFAAFTAVKVSVAFIILFILFSYFRLHEAFPILMPFKIPKLLALASCLVLFGIFSFLKNLSLTGKQVTLCSFYGLSGSPCVYSVRLIVDLRWSTGVAF